MRRWVPFAAIAGFLLAASCGGGHGAAPSDPLAKYLTADVHGVSVPTVGASRP